MRILFLYSELMGYTDACLRKMSDLYPEAVIKAVIWDEDEKKKTPYFPSDYKTVQYLKRSSFDDDALLNFAIDFNPDVVYTSGRMDKGYLNVARFFKKKGKPTIAGFDNQWHGTWRNRLIVIFARKLYHRYFSHIWTAGEPQNVYARKLGFSEKQIVPHIYSADHESFTRIHEKRKKLPTLKKTLLFVGRFAEVKGLDLLLSAFSNIEKEKRKDWKLKLIGNGPLKDTLPNQDNIEILDFLDPKDLRDEVLEDGVFVLPSTSEPWGVVIHEFATAGYPIVCSSACGAATEFVENGKNGFIFDNGNAQSLQEKLEKILGLTDSELADMRNKSHELSRKITPASWAQTLANLVEKT